MKKNFIYIYLFIVICNVIVFSPSIYHVARSDHIVYLANTVNYSDWFTIAVKNNFYNRIEHVYRHSEEMLFRPLFFLLLGTERFLFGYHFEAWQITGIILHLCVIYWLLKVLFQVYPSIFAGILTLLFSMLFINAEAVIWHHVHGYLLFTIFILMSIYFIQLYKEKLILKHLWIVFFLLLTATFLYESGAFFSLGFAFYLFLLHKQKQIRNKWPILILLIPVLLFIFCYFSDLYIRGLSLKNNDIFRHYQAVKTIKNIIVADSWWIFKGFFPATLDFYPDQRPLFTGKLFEMKTIFTPGIAPNRIIITSWLSVVTVLLFLILIVSSISKKFIKQKGSFLLFISFLILSYTSLISYGRINVHGTQHNLMWNLYYSYIFWSLFIILIYSSIAHQKLKNFTYYGRIRLYTFCLIVILILSNGIRIYNFNLFRMAKESPIYDTNKVLRLLVNQHQNEKDFSFYIPPGTPNNPMLLWISKLSSEKGKNYSYWEMLYPQYWTEDNAKYLIE